LATALLVACESVKVVVPGVATVVISPSTVTLIPEESVQLSARVTDTEGNLLTGRAVQWSTSNSTIATVTTTGMVEAVGAGTATIQASVEGRSGSASITVVEGPTLRLDLTQVEFGVVQGTGDPPARTIAVGNAGAGVLNDLTATVSYQGADTGWLSAVLSTTIAPAQLRLSVDVEGLGPGAYRATVTVASPAASNGPQTLVVLLEISEAPPAIALNPASVGFSAIEGEADPSPQAIQITNVGAGTLSGLSRTVVYSGGPQGWLETSLAGTTAPTTLVLQPRTGSLTEGVYSAAVRVAAPAASNSPQEISVTFTIGVPPPTDVSVRKEGPDSVNAGDPIEYRITVRNNGPALAVGVIVQDTLPEDVTLQQVSDGGSVNGRLVTWPIIDRLDVGDSLVRTVIVAAPPDSGQLVNIAASTAISGDPVPGNNDGSGAESQVVTEVNPIADVELSKVGPDSVDATQSFTYVITVVNRGPSAAENVVVTDQLPPELAFVSATLGAAPDGAGQIIWPAIPSLGKDQTASYSVTVTAPANAPAAPVLNVASSTSSTDDLQSNNNDGSSPANQVTTTVFSKADLTLTKSAAPDPVTAGEQLTYTVVVANDGPSDASGVTVTDILPAQLDYATSSATTGSFNTGTGVWEVGALAAGTNATLTLVADVDPSAADSVVNVAVVAGAENDPDPANDTASVSTQVERSADVAVTKTASSGSVTAGGGLTYTVRARNDGPSGAGGVSVAETLPAGVTVGSATASQGSYNTTTNVWSVGTLSSGGNATLTLNVTAPTTGADTLVNTVTISATEPDPTTRWAGR
jgi:uncharacterized repeat protein (TIGR01451 family)